MTDTHASGAAVGDPATQDRVVPTEPTGHDQPAPAVVERQPAADAAVAQAERIDALFRKAAVEHSQQRLDGSVVLMQSVPMTLLVWMVIAMIVVALALAASFQYSTYERVNGALRSTGGDLKVYPNSVAILEQLLVAQGQVVRAGQPLAVLRGVDTGTAVRSDKEMQRDELERQMKNLAQNKERAVREAGFELKKLQLSLESGEARIGALADQLELLGEQLRMDQATLAAREKMHGAGYVSAVDLEAQKATVLKTRERLRQLRNDQAEAKAEIAQIRADIESHPTSLARQTASIDNQVSELARQIIQLDGQIEHTVFARQDARVGNIVALEGEVVQPQFPLLTLTAPDAELVAELYVPSRSRAFIRKGLQVYLRFDSLPSEFYGDMRGTVVEVSDVMLFPDDWPNPMKISHPVFKVIVHLERQHMLVNGEPVALQNGLPVDADIILERRSMLEHLLAPILKVKNDLH